ncbi:MAG: hypothetical protein J6S40_05910, partial [Thermoguttaceae bacterium]|nr:hypothetical protein [Thermoguttaceae bacterium]
MKQHISFRKLRLESLEDRTLLAVAAGGTELAVDLAVQNRADLVAVPDVETLPVTVTTNGVTAVPAATESEETYGGNDLANVRVGEWLEWTNGTFDYDAAYDRIGEKIARINAYFNSPTYSAQKTKDYALYFAGGGNAGDNKYEYYANMVDFYCTLTTELHISPENIYILYADGTSSAIDRNDSKNSDMSFATNFNTRVFSATNYNLQTAMNAISAQMDEESHLLFFSYDHGSGLLNNSTDYSDYLCGWGENISGAQVAAQLFKVKEGYVTCVFTQCFAGGILDDVFTVSTGKVNKSYSGNAHFYGAAATNHYELSYTSGAEILEYILKATNPGQHYDFSGQYGLFFGFAQSYVDAISPSHRGLLNTRDCFAFAKANDYWAADENYLPNGGKFYAGENLDNSKEHPWGMGESFDIFGFVTVSPDLDASNGGSVTKLADGTITLKTGIIKNIGPDDANAGWKITVYASTDTNITTGDYKLAESIATPKLASKQSTTLTISNISTDDLPAGNYYIGWIISDVAGETKLNNNTAYCTRVVKVTGSALPDLTPSLSGTVTAVSNGKFTLKGAVVKNSGKAASGGYTVTVYASADSTINTSDTKLASYSFPSLGAGETYTIPNKDISVSGLTAGKTYYIGWIISGVSGETNTSNNTAKSGTITIPAQSPDLTPSLSGAVTAVSNGKFTLKGAVVKNNGKAASGGYTVTVYASSDSTINTSDTKLASYS